MTTNILLTPNYVYPSVLETLDSLKTKGKWGTFVYFMYVAINVGRKSGLSDEQIHGDLQEYLNMDYPSNTFVSTFDRLTHLGIFEHYYILHKVMA